jgi:hypothetical protein
MLPPPNARWVILVSKGDRASICCDQPTLTLKTTTTVDFHDEIHGRGARSRAPGRSKMTVSEDVNGDVWPIEDT